VRVSAAIAVLVVVLIARSHDAVTPATWVGCAVGVVVLLWIDRRRA
jgi:hypothetical protein